MQTFLCPDFTKSQYYFSVLILHQSVGGIVVSKAAFQAIDPGSIPGRRKNCSIICLIERKTFKTES